jgi:hypothetical protein
LNDERGGNDAGGDAPDAGSGVSFLRNLSYPRLSIKARAIVKKRRSEPLGGVSYRDKWSKKRILLQSSDVYTFLPAGLCAPIVFANFLGCGAITADFSTWLFVRARPFHDDSVQRSLLHFFDRPGHFIQVLG